MKNDKSNIIPNDLPKTVDEAVDMLLNIMSLKDKASVANMEIDDLVFLHMSLGNYIRNNFNLWKGNLELMKSCIAISKDKHLDVDVASSIIIEALYQKLQETHKIKIVK